MFQNLSTKQKDFFSIPRKTFALVNINPVAENKQSIICYGHYILTFMFTMASLDFSLKNMDNIKDFTLTVSLLNQLIISLSKIGIFFVKRQRIMKLIKQIWQWNEKAKGDEFLIIDNISSKCIMISKLYYMTVAAAGLCGLLRPIVIKLLTLLQEVEIELELPHKASFFWNTSTYLGYTAAYIWNIIIINFVLHASVAMDSLFLWFVANMIIRFYILKQRLKKAAQKNLQNSRRVHIIIMNIKFHLKILHLAKELDEIFGEIIFIKSLVSCTQICFLAFRFTGKDASVTTLYYPFVFLAAVVMQLFLYCYSGQLIEEQSLTVSPYIFEHFNWSQLPSNCQKILQMIMLRSQRCCNINGIFFNLNLHLYLWFFKTAGSLIAVLKTMEDDV